MTHNGDTDADEECGVDGGSELGSPLLFCSAATDVTTVVVAESFRGHGVTAGTPLVGTAGFEDPLFPGAPAAIAGR